MLAFAQGQVHAATTTSWTAGTSSWFIAGNWSDGVPTGSVLQPFTNVGNGGTAQINGAASAQFLTINNGSTLELQAGGSLSAPSIVVGNSQGTGTLFLNGSTTGITSITLGGGKIKSSTTSTLNSSITIDTSFVGASFDIASGTALTVTAPVTGGPSTLTGGGTLVLTAANNVDNVTVSSGSTLQVGAGGTTGSLILTPFGSRITDNGSVIYNRSDNVAFADRISGTGSVFQNGTGTLTLTSAGTYSGGTFVNAGILRAGSANIFSSASVFNVIGGTLDLNGFNQSIAGLSGDGNITLGSATLTAGSANVLGTYGGIMSGTGGFTYAGTSTFFLTGTNSYTGITTIGAGATLQLGIGGTSGSIAGNVTDNGTLIFNHSDNVTFGGVVSGTGSLSQDGTGTLTLTGANTYTSAFGYTGVTAGTLKLGSSNALAASGRVVVNGGTLDLNGFNLAIGGLAGAGGTIALGANSLTINTNAAAPIPNDLASTISGSGSIVLSGNGLLTLTGTNSYSGGTNITGGTVAVSSDAALGAQSGSVFLSNSGTLRFKNSFSSARAITVSGSGGTLDLGAGTANLSGAISGTSLTIIGLSQVAGTLALNGSISVQSLAVNNAGVLDLRPGSSLSVSSGLSLGTGPTPGTLTLSGGSFNIAGPLRLAAGSISANVTSTIPNTITLDPSYGSFITTAGGQALTLSGPVGGGSLEIAGSGTTIVTGDLANTSTTVNGALQVGNGGTVGTLSGNIIDNGRLTFNRSDVVTFGGVISGTGSLTQFGPGTLILTGVNTYTGGTTIATGAALQIGGVAVNAMNTGTLPGNVTNNGTLTFARLGSLTYDGIISGSGRVAKLAAGTLILTKDQTYTGGTSLSGGTLQLGNGGTSGSILGNIDGPVGTVAFNRSDVVTFGSTIGGFIGIQQIGSGSTILTGANSSGMVSVTNGTLRLGAGGSVASGASVTIDGGTFDLNDHVVTVGTLSGAGGRLLLGSGKVIVTVNGSAFRGVISGSGGVEVTATPSIGGRLVLTGENTYTGGTTVSGGAFEIGNGGTSGSVMGGIVNNSVMAINRSDTVIFSNIVSGSGRLIHSGSGTLILTGENTYTGGTEVDFGTLQIGNGGVSGWITGDVVAGGAGLAFNRSDNVVFAGSISSGNIRQIGAGSVTLNGALSSINTLGATKGTLILGPTATLPGGSSNLQLSGTGRIVFNMTPGSVIRNFVVDAGSVSLAVANGKTVTFSSTPTVLNSTTLTIGDAINTGRVVFGAGSIGFSRTSVTTIIGGGTLQIGTGESSGTFSGDLLNNGTLAINRANTITYADIISGSGGLTQMGSGTLILTGANTYTGTTTINAGTLQIGSGGATGSVASNIANNGTLIFSRSDAISYVGMISGTGSVTKTGAGILTLAGTNTYAGATSVSAGTLNVTGSTASSTLSVANGATLSGTGTVGTTTVASGGTVAAAGNGATGTLSINGNLTMASGSLTAMDITSSAADKLTITGTASLNGALNASFFSGQSYAAGTQYTLVTSTGTLSGTFSSLNLTGLPAGLAASLRYDAHDAYLTLSAAGFNWNAAPADGNFNNTSNWSGRLVPGSSDVGVFGASTIRTLSVGSDVSVAGLSFTGTPPQPAYTFNIGTPSGNTTFLVSGTGISGNVSSPVFNLTGDAASGRVATMSFTNSASAGGATINVGQNGVLSFANTSTAQAATMTVSTGGRIVYSDDSTGGSRISVTGGTLDLTNHNAGSVSIATLTGFGGAILLGSTNLTTGTGSVLNPSLNTVISGSGSFTKAGQTTTLRLLETNTYTGATSVAGGTLALSEGGSIAQSSGVDVSGGAASTFDISETTSGASIRSLSGSGLVSLGNKTLTLTNAAGIFSGSITNQTVLSGVLTGGSGGLVLAGGTEILTGDSDYAGGTTISGGTLQLGSGGTSGSITGNIVNNGVLAVNRSNAVTIGTAVSGSGGVTQAGSGGLTLTGANTYTGLTTISAGTLALAGAGSIAASGGVADNAIFDISATSAGASIKTLSGNGIVNLGSKTLVITNGSSTFTGTINGTGSVVVSGGMQNLAGTNNYSGGTTVSGTLHLDSSGAAGSGPITTTGSVLDYGNGVVIANPIILGSNTTQLQTLAGVEATQAGIISQTGGSRPLEKVGAGVLVLAATETYTGPTTVSGGTLRVNGSIAASSSVNVASGATLSGTGILSNAIIQSGGILAPGNSIGTMAVTNVTFAAGSAYQAEVNAAGQSDLINASGTASLNGTVTALAASGNYTPVTTYRILNAAGITGSFASVISSTASLTPSLVYGATSVDLRLTRNDIAFGTAYGTTANQAASGGAVSAGGVTTALYNSLAVTAGNAAAVPPALDTLSGEIHASLRSIVVQDGRVLRQSVLDHLATPSGDAISVWGDAFLSSGHVDSDGNAGAIVHNNGGAIAGLDVGLGYGLRAGVAGAHVEHKLNIASRASNARGQSSHLVVYGGWSGEAVRLRAGADFGWGSDNILRAVNFLPETDSSHRDSHSTHLFADAGYALFTEGAVIEPHAGLAWLSTQSGAFRETGGAQSALSGAAATDSVTYGILGIRARANAIGIGSDTAIAPYLDVGLQHGFNTLRPGQTLSFASGSGFTVRGAPLGNDAATVDLGLDFILSPSGHVTLGYDGSFSGPAQNHTIRAQLGWRW